MSSEITKITKLNITESFLQVNFEKGYKYVDKAGQLVDSFYLGDIEPEFNMSSNGLILRHKEGVFEEVKINPKNVWVHYKSPDTLDMIANNYLDILKRVCVTISADNFSRVGWRTYFVKEFNTQEDRDKVLQKFSLHKSLQFKTGIFEGEVNNFSMNFFVSKVLVESGEDRGLLIDIDLYKKFEEKIELEKIELKIKDILACYKSEALLEIINNVISK